MIPIDDDPPGPNPDDDLYGATNDNGSSETQPTTAFSMLASTRSTRTMTDW